MKTAIFIFGLILGQAGAYGYVLANPPQPVLVPYKTACDLGEHPRVVEITAMLESMPKVKRMLSK